MKRTLLQFRVESWIGKICTETVTDRLPMEKGKLTARAGLPSIANVHRREGGDVDGDDGWGTWLGERRLRSLRA